MQIPENLHEGGNSPSRRDGLLPPLAQIIFFEGGFRQTKCHVVAQTQGYHLVCIWGSLVKFQGGGVVVKTMLCASAGFAEFLYRGYPCLECFKAQCLPQIKGGLCLAGCHVVAQTQGYHLVCIWGSLVKFQGSGVVVKTMLCARVQIRWVFVAGLTPVFQSSMSPSN